MKMNRNIIAVLAAATMLLITQLGSPQSMADDSQDPEKLLVGFWAVQFPLPAHTWGYIFLDDHTYVYYDHNLANIKKKYDGSMGKWKIMDDKIYILKEKDFYWKKDWVEHKSVGYIPGKSNSLYAIKSDSTREMVGDINSYTKAKNYEKHNNKRSVKPANMMLRPPAYESYIPYWKVVLEPMEDIHIIRIVEERRKL